MLFVHYLFRPFYVASNFSKWWFLGGAIPVRGYSLSTGVGFKQPVLMRTVSFNAVSICLACVHLPHTRHAYSDTEKHQASDEFLTASE